MKFQNPALTKSLIANHELRLRNSVAIKEARRRSRRQTKMSRYELEEKVEPKRSRAS